MALKIEVLANNPKEVLDVGVKLGDGWAVYLADAGPVACASGNSGRLMMSGPLGPFGDTFQRLGDMLINKVADEIFGPSGAFRSTRVIIFNHSDQDLFPFFNSFSSGLHARAATAREGVAPLRRSRSAHQ